MLCEALPIYSGGLGNVAGDQLKAASDLGVPVVGVGLLFQQGYFRQVIDRDGSQQALFPYNDPGQLPITPLREPNGEWMRLEVVLPGYSVWLRTWQVQVGRATLYLLDSNDAANFPAHRGITSELYGGGPELRLKQELLLGIGGWRLLRAWATGPKSATLTKDTRLSPSWNAPGISWKKTGQPFEAALAVTRAGNLFTTHTAVPAGFDRFPPALIEQYLGGYAQERLGISLRDLLALGRREPGRRVGAVQHGLPGDPRQRRSQRRQSPARMRQPAHLFAPLFPALAGGRSANRTRDQRGSHAELGFRRRRRPMDGVLWKGSMAGNDGDHREGHSSHPRCPALAASHRRPRGPDRVCARAAVAAVGRCPGHRPGTVEDARHFFDPNALTLGFARRFATYKRPNLLLHDPARLLRLLTNPRRPVQLFIAGKAHPEDKAGQALIQQWVRFIRQPAARLHVVFLSDYDMLLTEQLVQGVDVWINTPRRPWEASGTSGMKVLVNGGLNLSELDGWWAEAYTPEVGWALGDGKEHDDDPAWDAAEAEALYDLLENQVVPEFYARDENGIPTAWVARIRESMARLAPQFSANRTVREYTEQYYLPAATAYRRRAADRGVAAMQIVDRRRTLQSQWDKLRIGKVTVKNTGKQNVFEVQVYLNEIDPGAVRVELYADARDGDRPVTHEMALVRPLVGTVGGRLYRAAVPAARPTGDYTVRVVPNFPDLFVPLEASPILWQR